MSTPQVLVAPGQRWAVNDRRYGEWRYLTVESVDGPVVVVRGRRGRKSTWRSGRFGRGSRFLFCGHDGPGVLPAYTGPGRYGCMFFGWPPELPLEFELEMGFGLVAVMCNGQAVWSAGRTRKRLAHIEMRARAKPDSDWRLQIDLPLGSALYQRHDLSTWVLVAVGMGFA